MQKFLRERRLQPSRLLAPLCRVRSTAWTKPRSRRCSHQGHALAALRADLPRPRLVSRVHVPMKPNRSPAPEGMTTHSCATKSAYYLRELHHLLALVVPAV